MSKIVKIDRESVEFDTGEKLVSNHDSDCCEHHWLQFDDLKMEDVEGLEFDLNPDGRFFERVPDYGIRLIPTNGHPVGVAGYGSNNGYYSSNIDLLLVTNDPKAKHEWDVSECQSYEVD